MKSLVFVNLAFAIVLFVWAFDVARRRIKTLYACDYYDGVIKECNIAFRILFANFYTYVIEYVNDDEEIIQVNAMEHKITLFKNRPQEPKDREIVIAKSKYYPSNKATVIEFKKRYWFIYFLVVASIFGIYYSLKYMGMF